MIDDHTPDTNYSVCMQTVAGYVYLSEFRTLDEAVRIAERANETSGASIVVRQDGRLVRSFEERVSSVIH